MVEQIFTLLSTQPVLSISLGVLLAGFLAYIFRDVIKQYIKKKYDLYDKAEIYNAVEQAVNDRVFSDTVSNKTNTESLEKFSTYLEKK